MEGIASVKLPIRKNLHFVLADFLPILGSLSMIGIIYVVVLIVID